MGCGPNEKAKHLKSTKVIASNRGIRAQPSINDFQQNSNLRSKMRNEREEDNMTFSRNRVSAGSFGNRSKGPVHHGDDIHVNDEI